MLGGAYLTDGKGLFLVIRALGNEVLLEDCAHPDLPLVAVTVKSLVADGYTVVRPSR